MNVQFLPVLSMAVLAAGFAFALDDEDAAKWDPRMAQENAVVDTNGVKWIDGRYLPIEGRPFRDAVPYFARLPEGLSTNVNAGVRNMRKHTAGMQFRFRTDAKSLTFRWENGGGGSNSMPPTGTSGIDIYRFDTSRGKWRYVRTGSPRTDGPASVKVPWTPGDACLVNLPLYAGVRSFALGVPPTAKIESLGPRKSGIDKPVVFYGTSITHGGCASRPGMAFVNIVGRDLDVPVVNLGFSGSGVMEYEMSDWLAKIDASCYVLDCLWNMGTRAHPDRRAGRNVDENYEPFIRNLRAKRPGVPIVMAEQCDVFGGGANEKDGIVRRLYEKLLAEGWTDLVYLPKTEMYAGDGEGTVDGCHPNDWGMVMMARAYGKAVSEALKK